MCKDASGPFGAPFLSSMGHQSGLSLIELITSMGLVATLSTVGLQSFQYYLAEARADVVINSLRTTLALARSEAVTRNSSVVLCRKSSEVVGCAGNSSRGRPQWRQGWLLFQDVDNNRLYDPNRGDILMKDFPAVAADLVLKWNRGDFIGYQGSGTLDSLNGTFCLASLNNDPVYRELKIPYTGRVRITSGECSYSL